MRNTFLFSLLAVALVSGQTKDTKPAGPVTAAPVEVDTTLANQILQKEVVQLATASAYNAIMAQVLLDPSIVKTRDAANSAKAELDRTLRDIGQKVCGGTIQKVTVQAGSSETKYVCSPSATPTTPLPGRR